MVKNLSYAICVLYFSSFFSIQQFVHPKITLEQIDINTVFFILLMSDPKLFSHMPQALQRVFACNFQAASGEEDEAEKDDVKEKTTEMKKVGAKARLGSRTAVSMISLHTFWFWCYF